MNMTIKLVFVTAIFIVGCATGQFFDAAKTSSIPLDGKIQYLLECLKTNPEHIEAKALIKQYYEQSADEHLQQSKNFARAKKYYLAIGELDKLIILNKSVKPWVSVVRDVSSERSQLVTEAGQYYYSEGERYESSGNYQEAAKNFRMSANYTPNYRNVEARYRSVAEKGTIRICIMPFENKQGEFATLGQDIADEILATTNGMNPEFLEFVNRQQMQLLAQERNLSLPEIMTPEDISQLDKTMPADVFVLGTVSYIYGKEGDWKQEQYRDENPYVIDPQTGRPIFAIITRFYKTNMAQIKVSYQEVDVKTTKVGGQKVAEKNIDDTAEYAQFVGNPNALSPRSKKLLHQQQSEPKDPRLLVQDLVRAIGKEMGVALFRKHKK